MKKSRDYNYLIIGITCVILILLISKKGTVFGSFIDWSTQHIIFPDYFRKLFYETKNFFPNFALSLGAGQNIYNFSYYGLFSPLILISYLLPFLNMKTYIIILNIIIYISTNLICYYFFKTKTTKKISLITTLFLVLSAPLLFHLHRHFMFVNYYPFLFLGLIGVDKYLENKNMSLEAFSIFMIIMTSYYYAIPCILVICIYAIYRYIELNKQIDFKDLLKVGTKFLIPIFISIITSAFLLLPTYYSLKEGRTPSNVNINFITKLLPKLNIDAYLYDNYSMGLTVISIISALSSILSEKKSNRILGIILLILINIPEFIYLLNGNLYFRNKVLIPFIPLLLILISNLLKQILEKKNINKELLIISLIIILVSIISKYNNPAIYIDLLIFTTLTILFIKNKVKENIYLPLILLVPLITLLVSNYNERYLSNSFSHNVSNKSIENILQKEKDLVRFNKLDDTLQNINYVYKIGYNNNSIYSSISNQLYKNFYVNIFNNTLSYRNNLMLSQNNNILFQTFMGVKYIYSPDIVPIGYHKLKDNIYVNDNVIPMFYGTNKITNEQEFTKINYPNNIENLLFGVVTKDKTNYSPKHIFKEEKIKYKTPNIKNLSITKNKDLIIVDSKENSTLTLDLEEPLKDKVLLINFEVLNTHTCKEEDSRITINDISNVKTCNSWTYKNNNNTFHYVLSSNKDIDKLVINFNKGIYEIKNIETYTFNYEELNTINEDKDKFIVDKNKSLSDNIYGTINMKESGYFVTSIPYDKGFTIKVDGKKVPNEIVNKAFLGCKLKEGKHNIEINYKAPYQKEGLIISIFGIISYLILIIYERKNKHD